MSTDLSTPPHRRNRLSRGLWKTWFPEPGASQPGPLVWRLLRALSAWGAAAGRSRLEAQCRAPRLPIPVIAVGNSLVGGAGKTPACLGLLEGLQAAGLRAGLLSRGYRSRPALGPSSPPRVLLSGESADPGWIGDEAHLIHERLGIPVAVHPDRYRAGQDLLARAPLLDVLVLDDGLSQTSLRPSLRVLVLDERLRGNGLCLPTGPNRFPWPPPIAAAPQFVLLRGDPCAREVERLLAQLPTRPVATELPMQPAAWIRAEARVSLDALGQSLRERPTAVVWAVAGIAEPGRFFQTLRALGIELSQCLALEDHAAAPWEAVRRACRGGAQSDTVWPDLILTTEKDWAKFQTQDLSLPLDRVWALQLSHSLSADWLQVLLRRLQSTHGLQSA